jgi:DNA-binding transcriptional regulator YiaG
MAHHLSPSEVRTARADLGLSASEAAVLVGLNDGAAWRRWERNGVTGPGAVLIRALMESRAVRRHFGIETT